MSPRIEGYELPDGKYAKNRGWFQCTILGMIFFSTSSSIRLKSSPFCGASSGRVVDRKGAGIETGLFVLVTSANKTDHHRTGVVGDGKSINFYIGDRFEVVGCNC